MRAIADSLGLLMLISLMADMITISLFLFSVVVRRNYERLPEKTALIAVMFVAAIALWQAVLQIDSQTAWATTLSIHAVYVAGIAYYLISAATVAMSGWVTFDKAYRKRDFFFFVIVIFVPYFFGSVVYVLLHDNPGTPFVGISPVFLYTAMFLAILMSKNYVANLVNKRSNPMAEPPVSLKQELQVSPEVSPEQQSIIKPALEWIKASGKTNRQAPTMSCFAMEFILVVYAFTLGIVVLVTSDPVFIEKVQAISEKISSILNAGN